MKIELTRELPIAASRHAANRTMRAGGGKACSIGDAEVARMEIQRLWPLCRHFYEPEWICPICNIDREPVSYKLSNGEIGYYTEADLQEFARVAKEDALTDASAKIAK